jgi:hypothetical protein
MLMPMPIHAVADAGRRNSDEVRRRALERLYMRKAAVDELILSLQNYEKIRQSKTPCVIPFSAARKCS